MPLTPKYFQCINEEMKNLSFCHIHKYSRISHICIYFCFMLCCYLSCWVCTCFVFHHSISPNVRTYVYEYGMQSGGTEADWDKMWDKYVTETVPQERVKILNGLAHTKEIWLLNRCGISDLLARRTVLLIAAWNKDVYLYQEAHLT